jgi:hypothetical protein
MPDSAQDAPTVSDMTGRKIFVTSDTVGGDEGNIDPLNLPIPTLVQNAFDALPSGVTHVVLSASDGAANRTTIQAAVDLNKSVLLPQGTFPIAGQITVGHNGVTISGHGMTLTTLHQETVSTTTFLVRGDDSNGTNPPGGPPGPFQWIAFRKIRFTGTAKTDGQAGITTGLPTIGTLPYAGDGFLVEDCFFEDLAIGLDAFGIAKLTTRRCFSKDCATGLKMHGSVNNTPSIDWTAGQCDVGIHCDGATSGELVIRDMAKNLIDVYMLNSKLNIIGGRVEAFYDRHIHAVNSQIMYDTCFIQNLKIDANLDPVNGDDNAPFLLETDSYLRLDTITTSDFEADQHLVECLSRSTCSGTQGFLTGTLYDANTPNNSILDANGATHRVNIFDVARTSLPAASDDNKGLAVYHEKDAGGRINGAFMSVRTPDGGNYWASMDSASQQVRRWVTDDFTSIPSWVTYVALQITASQSIDLPYLSETGGTAQAPVILIIKDETGTLSGSVVATFSPKTNTAPTPDDTLNEGTTVVMNTAYQTIRLMSTGDEWIVLD